MTVRLSALLLAFLPAIAQAQTALPPDINPVTLSRLPPVTPEDLDEEGRKLLASRPAPTPGPGPTHVTSYSPSGRSLGIPTGENSPVGPRFFQLAVLIIAREIDQQYEWTAHEPAGLRQGLEQPVIDVVNDEHPRSEIVLAVDLPRGLPGDMLQARDEEGNAAPLQVDVDRRASFILTGLKAGERRRLTIEPSLDRRPRPVVDAIRRTDRVEITVDQQMAAVYRADTALGSSIDPSVRPELRRGGYLHPIFTPEGRLVTDEHLSDEVTGDLRSALANVESATSRLDAVLARVESGIIAAGTGFAQALHAAGTVVTELNS